MDELAISEVSEPIGSTNNIFLFQQVAVLREQLLKGKNWNNVTDYQIQHIFIMTDRTDPDLKRLADLYSDDVVGDVIDPKSAAGDMNNNGQEDEYEDI